MELNIYVVNQKSGASKSYKGYNFETKEEALNFMFGLSLGFAHYSKTVCVLAFCEGVLCNSINLHTETNVHPRNNEDEFINTLNEKRL